VRNLSGTTNTRGATPLIRAANNNDLEMVKLLLEKGADATLYMADRQTPIHAVLSGRAPESRRAQSPSEERRSRVGTPSPSQPRSE